MFILYTTLHCSYLTFLLFSELLVSGYHILFILCVQYSASPRVDTKELLEGWRMDGCMDVWKEGNGRS